LRRLIASVGQDVDPQYSRDGTKIVYIAGRNEGNQLWISDQDGSNQHMIHLHGGSPSWSPDGKHLVFDSPVQVIPAVGGDAVFLYPAPFDGFVPTWSHDGKAIYFCSRRSGSPQIWKADYPVTGPPVQITQHGGFEARESLDGKYLYYSRSDDHSRSPILGVWRMPLDGSGREELVEGTTSVGTHRDWDITARALFFLETSLPEAKPDAGTKRTVLRSLDFATNRLTTITTFSKPPAPFQRALAASPDGRSFLYAQIDSSRQEIRLVENFQ